MGCKATTLATQFVRYCSYYKVVPSIHVTVTVVTTTVCGFSRTMRRSVLLKYQTPPGLVIRPASPSACRCPSLARSASNSPRCATSGTLGSRASTRLPGPETAVFFVKHPARLYKKHHRKTIYYAERKGRLNAPGGPGQSRQKPRVSSATQWAMPGHSGATCRGVIPAQPALFHSG